MEDKSKISKKPSRASGSKKSLGESLGFGKLNYILLAIGLGFIVLGYIFLASGSITIAPILLVIGYCVILPIGILINPDRKKKAEAEAQTGLD